MSSKKSTSAIADSIKKRKIPNDVFITPVLLAKKQINMIEVVEGDVWFDPFKATGNFFNQFPNTGVEHIWGEITEGRDFLTQNVKCDVICSNPPYSLLDKVFRRCIELNPKVVSFLIGVGNLTTRRIEMMEKANYSITKLHMCKIFQWYGMSYIVQFEKSTEPCMTYDRIIWRDENPNTKYVWEKKAK